MILSIKNSHCATTGQQIQYLPFFFNNDMHSPSVVELAEKYESALSKRIKMLLPKKAAVLLVLFKLQRFSLLKHEKLIGEINIENFL